MRATIKGVRIALNFNSQTKKLSFNLDVDSATDAAQLSVQTRNDVELISFHTCFSLPHIQTALPPFGTAL